MLIDFKSAKLLVFIDSLFANNSNLISQISFIVVLVNKQIIEDRMLALKGNLLHQLSTKCRRVTRSVLVSKIYVIVTGFDLSYMLLITLRIVTKELNLLVIPLILYIDSFSLYKYFVKLGTTLKKRLIIDILVLQQLYEYQEIYTVRQI